MGSNVLDVVLVESLDGPWVLLGYSLHFWRWDWGDLVSEGTGHGNIDPCTSVVRPFSLDPFFKCCVAPCYCLNVSGCEDSINGLIPMDVSAWSIVCAMSG